MIGATHKQLLHNMIDTLKQLIPFTDEYLLVDALYNVRIIAFNQLNTVWHKTLVVENFGRLLPNKHYGKKIGGLAALHSK